IVASTDRNGTYFSFTPDEKIFKNFRYNMEYVENMMWNYVFLNRGLVIMLNGNKIFSENGLRDLIEKYNNPEEFRYPVIHLKGEDMEIALTHSSQYGEQYYSFVNGQHTTQGGTHLAAFREAVAKTAREFYKKEYDPSDVRTSIEAAISIRIQEPVFEIGRAHV